MIVQMLLLGALAGTVGLGAAGWAAGIACALVWNAAVARLIAADGAARLTPATWVTLGRASLAVGVAALAGEALAGAGSAPALVGLTLAALVLDGVDGRVARRTGVSALGGRLDGEADALLMLALSAAVGVTAGWWVLAIGVMRYAFLVAGWLLPWMRAPLPFRYWRKVVTAVQGIVLTVAAAEVLPLAMTQIALVVALAMLAESFGRDVLWLWRRRDAAGEGSGPPDPYPGGGREAFAACLTILALLLVWVALVSPDRLTRLTPGEFARVPLEGLLLIGLAVLLPPLPRRILAAVVGLAAGVLLIVKLLNMGFHETFDRPFNPVEDWAYAGIGIETLRTSVGAWQADLAMVAAAAVIAAVLVLTPLAVIRLAGHAAAHRGAALRLVAILAVVGLASMLAGPQLATGRSAGLAVDEARALRAGLEGRAEFTRELHDDALRDTSADRLLTGLRGKDVLVVFVESYGRVAVQDSWFSPGVRAVLARGQAQLRDAGFSARSGFLGSSTFGGFSWLAHGTLQAGVWVDSRRRYDQLVTSDRFTLARAFERAGWRTIGVDPANNRDWPEGRTFYHYDAVYDSRNVGYRGPRFAFGTMPDQYILAAMQRQERSHAPRPPLFAEVDLVSSHEPWTRIPTLVGWDEVGDGSVFGSAPAHDTRGPGDFHDARGAQADYGHSIEYSLETLFSYISRYGGEDLVVVMLGDHQPSTLITGEGPGHDVPVTIIAHDPAVLARTAGWGWDAGTLPRPDAPVWPMDSFRDRFLRAFGPVPAGGGVTPRSGEARACARPCAPSSPDTARSPATGARPSPAAP